MNTFLAIFIIFVVFFILMSLRIVIKGEKEFRGTCASNNPMLANEVGECKMCGKKPSADCDNAQAS